jgi:ABC-type glycerol-3-phosphate transport system permease component
VEWGDFCVSIMLGVQSAHPRCMRSAAYGWGIVASRLLLLLLLLLLSLLLLPLLLLLLPLLQLLKKESTALGNLGLFLQVPRPLALAPPGR